MEVKRKYIEIGNNELRKPVPKPNQEEEQKEIERIFKEETGLEVKVQIISDDLRHIDIPLNYDILLMKFSSKNVGKFQDLHFNHRFKEYGIKYYRYMVENSAY